ncbi:MAG: formate dehydrogenase accessory sulfurtransferase FdhD [Myxococcales bacterium]|nr:formate dehydrogenase accessory sulfurtransferase FdhD [Myxococcales bacterium]
MAGPGSTTRRGVRITDRRTEERPPGQGNPRAHPSRAAERNDRSAVDDAVVVEEPLEIRFAGDLLATTMRTPGHDHDLVLGFLWTEGLIDSAADVGTVAPCGRLGEPGYGNVVDVAPGPGVAIDPVRVEAARRMTPSTAACGVCGRRSIDTLLDRVPPLSVEVGSVAPDALLRAPEQLREEQPLFGRTGGLHGAAALDADGSILARGEDVGRHNAVDKVCGALLRHGLRDRAQILVVSSRLGYEIVQKAIVARFPCVVGVSAASSLAIDLADRAGLTVAAFAREGRATVYTHVERLAPP